uniref:Col_cuticle_N domain-containing protein n=1 Tax=Strongyloides papillosus TaxID=174720 RepID=A0A0N5BP92_STREA
MYDIERFGVGLYLALVSIVIILILMAFCLVGAQESGDPTVAKQLYIDTKSAIENNTNLRKISTNFHMRNDIKGRNLNVTFNKMNVINSTKALMAPCNKDAVTILNINDNIEEINDDDNNSIFDEDDNNEKEDYLESEDNEMDDEEYSKHNNNNKTYLIKKHSIYEAIVTVHNNHLNV